MSGEVMVLRRAGALWGWVATTVSAVEPRGDGVLLRLCDGSAVEGDEVVALAAGLVVRPQSAAVRRRLPPATEGLALYHGEPLLVLESAGVPREDGA